MKKINGKWVVKVEENEVERFLMFCDAIGYNIFGAFNHDRSMGLLHNKKREYAVFDTVDVFRSTFDRVQRFDCNPKHRFDNVDKFIDFHFKNN